MYFYQTLWNIKKYSLKIYWLSARNTHLSPEYGAMDFTTQLGFLMIAKTYLGIFNILKSVCLLISSMTILSNVEFPVFKLEDEAELCVWYAHLL